jgi:hypothetical protein
MVSMRTCDSAQEIVMIVQCEIKERFQNQLETVLRLLENPYLPIPEKNIYQGTIDRLTTSITKIEEGTYGFCQYCKGGIALERLEEFPDVNECISCRQIYDKRRRLC